MSKMRYGFRLAAVLAALAAAPFTAGAEYTRVDEVTYFLTPGTFEPGGRVLTLLTFSTIPGVQIQAFDFTFAWDSAGVSHVQDGAGSWQAVASELSAPGTFSSAVAGASSVTARWTATDPSAPEGLLTVGAATPVRVNVGFEVAPALTSPFVVSVDMANILLADGTLLDTGSGYINWATMTPVPEPGGFWTIVSGLVLGSALLRRRQRPSGAGCSRRRQGTLA